MFRVDVSNRNLLPNPMRMGASRKQYQRILHESYQLLVKLIADQHAAEELKLQKARKKITPPTPNNDDQINTDG